MRRKTHIVAALWLSLAVVTWGEAVQPGASVPGELKQKAAELDQAVEAAKEAVLKEYFNATAACSTRRRRRSHRCKAGSTATCRWSRAGSRAMCQWPKAGSRAI